MAEEETSISEILSLAAFMLAFGPSQTLYTYNHDDGTSGAGSWAGESAQVV